MAQTQQDAVDESPVPAVSALRSRFEQMKGQPKPAHILTKPKIAPSISVSDSIGKPQLTPPLLRSRAPSPAPDGSALPPPIPRKPSAIARSRPQSMIVPELLSNNILTQSNGAARPGLHTAQSMPYERHSVDIIRPIARAGTDGSSTIDESVEMSKSNGARVGMNGARPLVPSKKPTLTTRPKPEVGLNTSVGQTPNRPEDNKVGKIISNEAQPQSPSIVALSTRKRFDSDASWVEQLQDTPEHTPVASRSNDSDVRMPLATSPERYGNGFKIGKTRPNRVMSNASWVENLDDESPRESPRKAFATPQLPDVIEKAPRLPARPVVHSESEADIPPRQPQIRKQRSPVRRQAPTFTPDRTRGTTPERASTMNGTRATPSALSQGFDRSSQAAQPVQPVQPVQPIQPSKTLHAPPALPAPRRSLDRRAELERPASSQSMSKSYASGTEYSDAVNTDAGADVSTSTFPESNSVNRRPPKPQQRPWQIPTGYDTKTMAVCDDIVCTTGYITRAWDLNNGEEIFGIPHQETVKVTSVVFKPTLHPQEQCSRIWLGTSLGEIHEVDIDSQTIEKTSQKAHRGREVLKLYRHKQEIWSLDESGELVTWQKDRDGLPSPHSQFISRRVHRGHSYSMVCDGHLWLATGKEIRVYKPSSQVDHDFFVTQQPLTQANLGEVTSGATLRQYPDLIYFGHTDGKISIYNRRSFRCERVIHASLYKIHALTGVGSYLWAGFGTGTMQVYDVSGSTWQIKKEWHAHEKQICSIIVDSTTNISEEPLRVVSLGTDNTLKLWDGSLEEDWLTAKLAQNDEAYCNFKEIEVAVLTWNAGASKPSHLEHNKIESLFIQQYLNHVLNADILVFGFQELVDLEDKKITAKSFFKSKKKDAFEQEHQSHQYRAWRDYLNNNVQACAPREYTLLHTASMIGLFSCVFVRASLRPRIQHVHQAEVKRGMGGHYGNKGALILRMVLDDSSLCFVNCHLAAGQTQTSSRNNDAAAILEAESLPSFPLTTDVHHSDVFPSGGSGSMILDHEICLWNGDLNYRIDTMSRDTVVKHIQQQNLKRLLERDQLLLSRKKYPGFKLRAFQEKAITFEPTYKYNVNSNEYDTSEKRRSPAWCDRILYRGVGKVKCEEYRRWEVKISDHRPVSALIKCRVKKVDPARRAKVLERCVAEFLAYKEDVIASLQ